MLHLDLHLYHRTRFTWPCLARGKPLVPQYTCSIPVLVHMFNLCFSTYVLLKLSKLHFNLHLCHGTCWAQPGCQGKSPYTCLIPVPVHMLNPTLGTPVKSQFQCICLIPALVLYPSPGTHVSSASSNVDLHLWQSTCCTQMCLWDPHHV